MHVRQLVYRGFSLLPFSIDVHVITSVNIVANALLTSLEMTHEHVVCMIFVYFFTRLSQTLTLLSARFEPYV